MTERYYGTGPYYCNGEIPECPNKEECYKVGGTCMTTWLKEYGAKERPKCEMQIVPRPQEQKKPDDFHIKNYTGFFWEVFIPAVVSVFAAFLTTLIITLAKM